MQISTQLFKVPFDCGSSGQVLETGVQNTNPTTLYMHCEHDPGRCHELRWSIDQLTNNETTLNDDIILAKTPEVHLAEIFIQITDDLMLSQKIENHTGLKLSDVCDTLRGRFGATILAKCQEEGMDQKTLSVDLYFLKVATTAVEVP